MEGPRALVDLLDVLALAPGGRQGLKIEGCEIPGPSGSARELNIATEVFAHFQAGEAVPRPYILADQHTRIGSVVAFSWCGPQKFHPKRRVPGEFEIFAAANIRDGGQQTITDEGIAAVCGGAQAQGMRAMAHLDPADTARKAILAVCTGLERGTFLDDATLQPMPDRPACDSRLTLPD